MGFVPFLLRNLGLACLVAGSSSLFAQSVIQSAPDEALPPPVLRKQAGPPPLSHPPPPNESPYRLGSVVLHPRLSYKHLNADGLPAAGRRVESEIRTLSLGLGLDLGENWTLDYNPSRVSYSSSDLANSTDQAVRLSGNLAVQDWAFNFSQSYGESNSPMIETARQTDQKTWATLLGATYRHGEKLLVQFSGALNERYVSVGPDIRTWSGNLALNYQVSPQISLMLSPGFKYTDVINEPDYYAETVMGQINWQPMEKLSLGIGGGIERTHSKSPLGVDLSNPLVNFTLRYQPFETTSVNISASRTVSASYFRAQATESFRWAIGFNQRLLGKLYLGANYSRQDADYVALENLLLVNRSDEIESYSLRLSTKLFKRLSVAIVSQKSRNTSNTAAFSFSSSQYGIELGYRY